jgi:hypothetical protein
MTLTDSRVVQNLLPETEWVVFGAGPFYADKKIKKCPALSSVEESPCLPMIR